MSVPIDDASGLPVYTGTWTHGAGDPLDFRDTLSTTSDGSAGVTFTFTGRYVAWVGPGGGDEEDNFAVVSTEGVPGTFVDLSVVSGRRKIIFEHTFASVGTRTLTIMPSEGTLPIDGFIVR